MADNIKVELHEVEAYYSRKIREFGETPKGVDWNDQFGQSLRFMELLKVVNTDNAFSINDLGCGYGALLELLISSYEKFERYFGIDISDEMIVAATKKWRHIEKASFHKLDEFNPVADYCIGSGIFNVKLNCPGDIWLNYIYDTLDKMNELSLKGFSFNCLTIYSDSWRMNDRLYYADPLTLFDLCKKKYSKNVALLHDYGLFEFTIVVKK